MRNRDKKVDVTKACHVVGMIFCRFGPNEFRMGNGNCIVKDCRHTHLLLSRIGDDSMQFVPINHLRQKEP